MKQFNFIVAEIFSIPEDSVSDEMSSKNVPEWDSMNYLLFIAELEKEFNVSFTMDQVMNAKNLGDLHRIVEAKE
jgi:acyl carrier protein